MRIISGKYGGRVLKQRLPSGIRPTTDKLRERIFNILNNNINWKQTQVVADIFAGTGAMGFEALSNGSKYCYFFENNIKAIRYIEYVANELQLNKDDFRIIKGNVINTIKRQIADNVIFDLCFIDPPYYQCIIEKVLYSLIESKLLSQNSIIVIEHSSIENILIPSNLVKLDFRKDGGSTIEILRLS